MPKVTVVNIPAETLPSLKAPTAGKQPPQRRVGQTLLSLCKYVFEKLLSRDALPLNILAFLLGRVVIMGELAPVGLAFFGAVTQMNRARAAGVAIWSLAGVVSTGRHWEAAVYVWTVILYYWLAGEVSPFPRRIASVPLFMFAAVTSGGLLMLLWQQATLYQVLLVMFEAVICTLGAYIFAYGIPLLDGRQLKQDITGEMLVCSVIILAAAVAGLGDAALAGYRLRGMAGALLIMSLAQGGGPGVGAAGGVAVGLAVSLTEGSVPSSIALSSLAGALAGMFRGLGRPAVILGYLLGAAITTLGFGQDQNLLLLLAETAAASLVFLSVPSRWVRQWNQPYFSSSGETADMTSSFRQIAGKLENISEMFNELAGAFNQLSAGAREKIREAELTRLFAAVGDRVCGECPRRSDCWERDFYRTYQAILDSLGVAEAPGGLNRHTLPEPLKTHCLKKTEIMETVRLVAERNSNNLYWQKRLADSRQMIIEQMRAASSIIATLAAEVCKQPSRDYPAGALIQEKAQLLGCHLSDIQVTGNSGSSSIEMFKKPCTGTKECIHTLLPLTANLLKRKLTLHAECGNAARAKCCRITMQTASRFALRTGMASAAKLAEGENGDTCSVVHLEQGKILMMLSDGMGSGRQAANESKLALNFLERLISAGFNVDAAVKTVNSMLLLRMPDESFATVDMAVIDGLSGEAEFLKIGSAPSFVKRVREVTIIRSATLPIGILNQIEIEPIKMQLTAGDIIIMVSDGISELGQRGLNRENWVANFLRRQSTDNPQELADRLLKQALDMSGGRAQDDMTVLAAIVVERPEITG